MGRDKALLRVGGRPLAGVVADALSGAGAEQVVAIGGDRSGLVAAGLTVVDDAHPGEGPLGGILTAIGRLAGPGLPVVVLACDLPAADPGNVAAVVAPLDGLDGPMVAVPVVDGRRQWMHACWSASAGQLLAASFEAGERATWRAAEESVANGLRIVEVAGPSPDGFRDVDQPSDLQLDRPAGEAPGDPADPGADR